MALFFQYQQCNFSHPIRLQFLWKDGREILALKASLRISLVTVSNHLESTCHVSASNPQRLEQGARLGQLCRYKRERTKTTRSSRWSLCRKVCTWKTPRRRSRALGEAGNRACQRLCKTLMHAFANSEPWDSAFEVAAKMCRPVSNGPRYCARLCQMPECSRLNAYDAGFGDP